MSIEYQHLPPTPTKLRSSSFSLLRHQSPHPMSKKGNLSKTIQVVAPPSLALDLQIWPLTSIRESAYPPLELTFFYFTHNLSPLDHKIRNK